MNAIQSGRACTSGMCFRSLFQNINKSAPANKINNINKMNKCGECGVEIIAVSMPCQVSRPSAPLNPADQSLRKSCICISLEISGEQCKGNVKEM